MNEQTREQLVTDITERVAAMDLATLQKLEQMIHTAGGPQEVFASPENATGEQLPAAVSRRRFLTGVAAGGAGAVLCAAGGGVAAFTVLRTENVALRGLLSFYESLEGVGLDDVIQAGLGVAGGLLNGIEGGATALRKGLETTENALTRFTDLFPVVRRGIESAETLVSAISERLAGLEAAAGRVLDRAKPITSAMGDAFDQALTLLPDALETRVRELLARAEAIITGIPEAVEGINAGLLRPLRTNWFGEAAEERLETSLIEPLRSGLFDPLEAHLNDLAELAETWEKNLVNPVLAAVARRDAIRTQIVSYRETNDLNGRR